MANLPLAFAELLAGGLLITAGSTGNSVSDVIAGNVTEQPLPGAGGSGSSTAASSGGATDSTGGGTNAVPVPTGTADPALKTKGVVTFDGKPVAAWIAPILAYGRAHGWKGTVSSGYRSLAQQTAIYDSGVRPAAAPGTSNHEGDQFPRGAVDVTDASQLSAILQASPFAHLLIWAGSKDPVHFSYPHNGGY